MTEPRPHRDALEAEEAAGILGQETKAGRHDPDLLAGCLRLPDNPSPAWSWIDLPLPTHNGFPIHARGIVESIPDLYFIGLLFLRSLSSALLGGVGRDAEYIVDHIASTRTGRRAEWTGQTTSSLTPGSTPPTADPFTRERGRLVVGVVP